MSSRNKNTSQATPFPLFHSFVPSPQLLAQIRCSFMKASHPQVLGTKRGFCPGPGVLGFICGRIHPDALQGEGSLGPQRGTTHGHREEDEGSRQLHRRVTCSVQRWQTQSHLGSPKSYRITAWMAPPTSQVSNEPISDLSKPWGLAGPHTLPSCPSSTPLLRLSKYLFLWVRRKNRR